MNYQGTCAEGQEEMWVDFDAECEQSGDLSKYLQEQLHYFFIFTPVKCYIFQLHLRDQLLLKFFISSVRRWGEGG